MSTKYKVGDEVPIEILCNRLDELSRAVTQGRAGIEREFSMRIPAEVDHDADLVLTASAKRLRDLFELLRRYRDETPLGHQPHMIAHIVDKILI